jgi:hypothetical protein
VLALGRHRLVGARREAERLLERLDAQPHVVGQHAPDLRERAVGVKAVAARSDQPERDRGRLRGREHQWRHAVAGP